MSGEPVGDPRATRPSTPTEPDEVQLDRLRRARLGRRVILALLAVFVGLGVVGLWGPRTGTTQAVGGDWNLEVEYPRVDRAGLTAPFTITVTRTGGFDGPVTVRVAEGFLAAIDAHGLDPQPLASTSAAQAGERYVQWSFEPPAGGSELIISYDGRIEPSRWGRVDGFVELVDDQPGAPRVDFTTWLAP